MFTRLALIAALLVQQVALTAVAALPRHGAIPPGCEREMTCCRVVERTTCCGERVVEMECGRTGGVCMCGTEGDRSRPAVPAPPRSRDMAFALQPRAVTFAVEWLRPAGALPMSALDRPLPSHNKSQARLGIWRT